MANRTVTMSMAKPEFPVGLPSGTSGLRVSLISWHLGMFSCSDDSCLRRRKAHPTWYHHPCHESSCRPFRIRAPMTIACCITNPIDRVVVAYESLALLLVIMVAFFSLASYQ